MVEKTYKKTRSKKHTMRLDAVPFNRIVNGSKTIELRLFDEKRRKLNVGDKIEFTNIQHKNKKVLVKVKGLFIASSFSDIFRLFSDNYFGFKHLSLDQKILKIRKYYSAEEEKLNGALAIWLQTIKR